MTTLSSLFNGTYSASAVVVTTTGTQTLTNKTLTNPIIDSGTANGVTYLNGSKALTSGSALVFDGTNLGVGNNSPSVYGRFVSTGGQAGTSTSSGAFMTASAAQGERADIALYSTFIGTADNVARRTADIIAGFTANWGSEYLSFHVGNNGSANDTRVLTSEKMRLTSTGLGIGTSSPALKLDVAGSARIVETGTPSGDAALQISVNGVNARTIRMTDTGPSGKTFDFINRAQSTAGNFGFFDNTAGVYRYIIDSSGNLGLGVTPSAFGAGRWMQFLSTTAVGQQANGTANLACNAYESSGNAFSYIVTAGASRYNAQAGAHAWFTAPSGTAGNAISFTQAMTLDASGNLGIGTSSPGTKLQVVHSGALSNAIQIGDQGTPANNTGMYLRTTGVAQISWASGGALAFYNSGSGVNEVMRLDSSGNLGIGTTTPACKLDVFGSAMNLRDGTYSGYIGKGSTVVDGGGTADLGIFSQAGAILFATGGGFAERARISTTGNLLIGTSTDNGTDKLQINGGVAFGGSITEAVFAVTGTTPALSPTNGSIQTWTLTANSTPTAGTWAEGQSITLMIDDGTNFSITWPTLSWTTTTASPPVLRTTGYTTVVLWEVGSVIYGKY